MPPYGSSVQWQARQAVRELSIEHVATHKLQMLDDADELPDLASPPGNRLEALLGNRKGQHSIRINDHGESASCGQSLDLKTWRSLTTTDGALHEQDASNSSRRNPARRIHGAVGPFSQCTRPGPSGTSAACRGYRARAPRHHPRHGPADCPLFPDHGAVLDEPSDHAYPVASQM